MFDPDTLNRLYRYAYTLMGEKTTAYDLLHDTVERCLKRPSDKLVNPENFARKVMRNRYIDMYRRQQTCPEIADNQDNIEFLAIDPQCLEETIINQDTLDYLWAKLDSIDREILYHWAIEEMSATEIANQTGSRRGTILSRMHRLRNKLRAEFIDELSPEGISP